MASTKKKLLSTVAAVATSAALLLGGTLAWQSTNQVALNEASDVINPGGRLHDDFDGENKDVYVENFTDPETGDPIYARVRLEEYFEIVTNYKTEAEKVHTLVGNATDAAADAVGSTDNTGESIVNIGTKFSGEKYERTYATYIFTEENVASGDAAVDADGNAWWKWTLGGQTDYMPTYNLNKDSLMADVNGKFDGAVGTITDRDATDPDAQYTADRQADFPYVEYTAGDTKEAYEVYDGDPNNLDEVESQLNLKDMIENGTELYPDNIVLSENKEVHTAATTLEGSLMSMAQWIAAGSQPGPYWVYDTDGWVYWAQAIEPGTATGLLLDGIELNQVMDDTWYYAINVIAQFVTADDVGKFDNTGFYDTNKGSAPTGDAETLLEKIGVNMSEGPAEDEDPGEEEEQFTVVLDSKIVSSISGNAEPTTNKATLYEYGEPYAGTVTWGIEAVYGTVDATTIDDTGAITIGNEQLGTESDEHEIFRVIAYIDGVEAASEKMMVQAFRSSNYPVHGFRFYQNGTEVAADQLVTGVTYDLESYVYFLSTNSETLANGEPLSDYANVIPAGELANVAIYTGQSTQIAPPVAVFENATFTANEANEYHITDEQLNLPDYMVWQFVTVSDAGSETSQLSSVKMTAGGMLDNYTWENLPYLPSDAAGSVTLTAYDEQDNALTDGITWSANSSMVSVADGVVSATQDAAAISSPVEEITVTAADANGGSADYTVYLYNANGHMYFGTVENENGTYYAFTPSGSGVPVMDDEPALYCISKKGAEPIRYFEYFANSTTAGMLNRLVQAYEDIVASGSTDDGAVTDHGLCPHIGGSGEEERTIATAYLETASGNAMNPPYLIQKDESYTVKAKNPDGSDFDDENPTLPEGYENARSVWMFYYNGELVNDSQTPLEFTGEKLAFGVGMSGSDAANVVTLDWAYMAGTSLADLIPLADMDGAHFYVYNYNTHTFLQSYDHGEDTYYLFEGASGEGNICAIKVGSIATDFLDTGAATVDEIDFDNAANWGTACGGHGSSNTDPIITSVKSDYAHYENGNVYVAPNSQVEFYCEGENLTDANITWELMGYGSDGSPIALDESFNITESPAGGAAITVSHNTCMDYEQCSHQPYYYTLSARLDGQEAVSFEKTIYPYELNFWTLTCGAEVEENGKQHIYLAPGETLTFTFTAPNGITNEQASWQFLREYDEEGTGNGLVKEGGFTLTEVGDRSATLSHDCESAEACVHETHLSHHLQVYADGTSMSKDTITIWMYAEPVTVELMESSDQLPYPSTYATLPVNTAVRLVCAENDADLSSVNTEITVRNESGAPGTESLSSDKYTYDESSHIIKFTDPSLAGDLITVIEAGNNYGKLFWLVEEDGSSPFTVSLSADAEEYTVGSSEDITFTATVTINDPDSGCTPGVVFIELPLTDEGYPYNMMYMSPAEGDSNTFTFTRNTANLTEDFTATAYTGGAVSQPVTIKAVPAPTYELSLSSTASQYPAGGSLEVTLTAAVTDGEGNGVSLGEGDITWTVMAGENDITAALTDNGDGTAILNTAGQSSNITVTAAYGDEASNSVTIPALANEEGAPTFSAADVTHTKTLASNLAPDSTVNVYAGTEVQLRSSNSSTDWEVEGAEIAKAGYNSEEGATGSFFHINVAEDAAGTQVTVTQTVGENEYAITLNVIALPPELVDAGTTFRFSGKPDLTNLVAGDGLGAVSVYDGDSQLSVDNATTRIVAVTALGGETELAYGDTSAVDAQLATYPGLVMDVVFKYQELVDGTWTDVHVSDPYVMFIDDIHTHVQTVNRDGVEYRVFAAYDNTLCVSRKTESGMDVMNSTGAPSLDTIPWDNLIFMMDTGSFNGMDVHNDMVYTQLGAFRGSQGYENDNPEFVSDENGKLVIYGDEDDQYWITGKTTDGEWRNPQLIRIRSSSSSNNRFGTTTGGQLYVSYGNGGESTIYLHNKANQSFTVQYILETPVFTLSGANGTSYEDVEPHGADTPHIEVYPGDNFTVTSSVSGEMSIEWENAGLVNNGFEDNGNGTYALTISEQTSIGATATITQTVGGEPYSIVLEVIDDYLKIDYIEDNSLIWEADGMYYTMLVNVNQNDVPAERTKGLTAYLYEAGTDTVVGTALDGTGVVYNETAGQFTVLFKMEDTDLTHDASYDLRLVENNGTEYTSNTLTFTYPTTINLAKVDGDSTLVGTPGSTYTYRRSTDAGDHVITSNNPAVVSYRFVSPEGFDYTNAIDSIQQTDDGWVLTISGEDNNYADFKLVAYDAEGNELSHIILSITY